MTVSIVALQAGRAWREVILDDGGWLLILFYIPGCVMEQRQGPGLIHHQHHQLCHPAQLQRCQ